MRENDSFRLIDQDDAVIVLCFIIALLVVAFVREEKAEAPQPQPSQSCAVTVAQYGPGERFAPNAKAPVCATIAQEIPAHILTVPVVEKK
jgi:hypothetical protein